MKIIATLLIGILAISPVFAASQIKEICKPKLNSEGVAVVDKAGKAIQECKKIKVHKKLEGTKVPDKK